MDGRVPAEEWIAPQLEGYRATAPVRCGNAAGEQHQHDVFGEVLDCAYQWAAGGGELIDPASGAFLGTSPRPSATSG